MERPLLYIYNEKTTYYIQCVYESAGKVNTFLVQPFSSLITDILFSVIVFLILGLYDFKLIFLLFSFHYHFYNTKNFSKYLTKTGKLDTGRSQKLLAQIKESLNSYPESKQKT